MERENPQKKLDRRARYTRMVLKQSLLQLMKEKPIAKISVKELCEKADVNRTTFYAHYNDIQELLEQTEAELFGSIQKDLENGLNNLDIATMITNMLGAIQDNADLCRVLFGKYGDTAYLGKILAFAEKATTASWKKVLPDQSDETLHSMYLFFSSGAVAVIRDWLLGGMQEPVEKLSAFLDRLCNFELQAMVR